MLENRFLPSHWMEDKIYKEFQPNSTSMIINKLEMAVKKLEMSPEFARIIPEVRSNMVMARENAQTVEDVAGIPGRITIVKGLPKAVAQPDYAASSHMARLVLTMMKYDPEKRSALNIKYHPYLVDICEKLGLVVASYDRNQEPVEVEKSEGSTIPWGVKVAVENQKTIPDVIYHTGGWGKEPMIVLMGTDPVEVAEMAICLAKLFITSADK